MGQHIRGQSQRVEGEPAERQLRIKPEIADALLAAALFSTTRYV